MGGDPVDVLHDILGIFEDVGVDFLDNVGFQLPVFRAVGSLVCGIDVPVLDRFVCIQFPGETELFPHKSKLLVHNSVSGPFGVRIASLFYDHDPSFYGAGGTPVQKHVGMRGYGSENEREKRRSVFSIVQLLYHAVVSVF
jgi:hypothetical protein